MSTPSPEDLLSAFLDGETSPAETARLEKQLSADPLLREQLQELREISSAVQQIPLPAPPVGLHESVMSAIRQLPIQQLPLDASENVSHEQSVAAGDRIGQSRSDGPATRRWQRWTGMICAALVLSLTASLLLVPKQWYPLAASLDEKLAVSTQAELVEEDHNPTLMAATSRSDAPVAMEMAAPSVSPMAAPSQAARSFAIGGNSLPQESLSISSAPSANVADVPIVKLTNEEIRKKIESLQRKPVSGNSIQVPGKLMVQGGETPIVVVFTVVDVHQAMSQMQVLLQKQQVRTLDNEPVKATFNADDGQSDLLKVVSVELEMEGSEMATLLNGVPALDAVLYVVNSKSTDGNPAGGKEAVTEGVADKALVDTDINASRRVRTAAPEEPIASRSIQEASSGVAPMQKSETYQFRFDQLAESSSMSRGRDTDEAQVTSLRETVSPGIQSSDAIQIFSSKPSVMKSEVAMKQKPGSPSVKSATTPARYRAFILFQQPTENGSLPMNK